MRHTRRGTHPLARFYGSFAPDLYSAGKNTGTLPGSRSSFQWSNDDEKYHGLGLTPGGGYGTYSQAQPGTEQHEADGSYYHAGQYQDGPGSANGANNELYHPGHYQSDQQTNRHGSASDTNSAQYQPSPELGREFRQAPDTSNSQYQTTQNSDLTEHRSSQAADNDQSDSSQQQQSQSQDDGLHPSQYNPMENPAVAAAQPPPSAGQHHSDREVHDLADSQSKEDQDSATLSPTNTLTMLPTIETSFSSTAADSHQTMTTASITPVPAGGKTHPSGLTAGAKAGLSVSVILIVAAIVGLIIYPMWRHHRRIQAVLGRNPKTKLGSGSDSDSEKSTQTRSVESVKQFASGLRAKATAGVCAASAFFKSKGPAAMSFRRQDSDIYTHSLLHSFNGNTGIAGDLPKSRDLEAGVVGPGAGAGASDGDGDGFTVIPLRQEKQEKRSLPTKFPLLSAASSIVNGLNKRDNIESNSPSSTEPGTRPGTATSSYNQSPRIPPAISPSPMEPLQPPQTSHSVSTTNSSAWETQHDVQSPLPSHGSLRSLSNFENNSTGNVLALSPSINMKYVVEQDFHASMPGQLDLKAGDAVGISQVLDNGWVSLVSLLYKKANKRMILTVNRLSVYTQTAQLLD